MHVDAVGVWNVDANEAQRVELTARFLAVAEVRRLVRVPVDRRRSNVMPVLVEDMDLLLASCCEDRVGWGMSFASFRRFWAVAAKRN
jgi:hypothetical protein